MSDCRKVVSSEQLHLRPEQISAFDIQMRDAESVVAELKTYGISEIESALDLGGGNGVLCDRLLLSGLCKKATVFDLSDEMLRRNKRVANKSIVHGDIFSDPEKLLGSKSYDVVFINMVLHHLVGSSSKECLALLAKACENLRKLCTDDALVVVYEQSYSRRLFFGPSPGRLIYYLTRIKNPLISSVFRMLGANTASVGVRFRSRDEWVTIFEAMGLSCVQKGDLIHKDNFGALKMLALNIGEVGSTCLLFKFS